MIFKGNNLWTYEKIAAFSTVARCKEYIEDYINEDVTKTIFSKQREVCDSQ